MIWSPYTASLPMADSKQAGKQVVGADRASQREPAGLPGAQSAEARRVLAHPPVVISSFLCACAIAVAIFVSKSRILNGFKI